VNHEEEDNMDGYAHLGYKKRQYQQACIWLKQDATKCMQISGRMHEYELCLEQRVYFAWAS
jgi:hypothetical protein